MNELYGAGVALVTPFHSDGSIDFEGLERIIEHQIQGGMDYLVSLGTTGETATLTEAERKAVWKFTAAKASGRVPLVAGIGGSNSAKTVRQPRAFDHHDNAANLSVRPSYNKRTPEGSIKHTQAEEADSPLHVIIFYVPFCT